MKIWPIAVLITLICLLSSGCRTDPRIALVERDNRRLEDEIYRLRACLEDSQSGMVMTETEVSTPRPSRRRDREDDRDSAPSSRSRDIPPGATTTPPSVEMQETPENEVPGINRRSSSAPTHANRPNTFDPPRNTRAMPGAETSGPALGGAAAEDPTPPGVPAENMSYSPPPKGDSFQAVQIVLHDRLCTASERDGIRVVFEPRDRNDRRVDAPADVSIVLIDPTLVPRGSKNTPPEARVARWDFPADAVASMFRGLNTSKVISIETPWPGDVPQQKHLLLFVRYTTRDGRKLQAGPMPIEIKQPVDRTARAKPPERLPPATEEPAGPALAQDDPLPAAESADNRREPLHTATRENAPRLQRPVWSPERR
jgi:hypothetical protein